MSSQQTHSRNAKRLWLTVSSKMKSYLLLLRIERADIVVDTDEGPSAGTTAESLQ